MLISQRLLAIAAILVLGGSPVWAEMQDVREQEIREFVSAAKRGDLPLVRRELDAGMPVDITLPPKRPQHPFTESTALEAAAATTQIQTVELLLSRGATLRRDDRHGVFAASMHTGDVPELLKLLVHHATLDTGVAPDLDADFGPALIRAAANGAHDEVRYLLSEGVDPNWRNLHASRNDPAIVRAGYDFEMIDLLLDAGADPMGGTLTDSWSPLFPAVSSLNVDRTRLFLEMGIDPHTAGERGNALSMAACHSARTSRPPQEHMSRANQIVKLLLGEGVDPNLSDGGRSPLRCAEDSHNQELAAMLEMAGARSRESLWNQVKRGLTTTAISVVLLFGGM